MGFIIYFLIGVVFVGFISVVADPQTQKEIKPSTAFTLVLIWPLGLLVFISVAIKLFLEDER